MRHFLSTESFHHDRRWIRDTDSIRGSTLDGSLPENAPPP
ncbi:Uncharacterised protein [Vibrio cholerae]|nr:Uncharacterised protein [Vibrio cholerae]